MERAAFCIQAGTTGSWTVSKCALAITASRKVRSAGRDADDLAGAYLDLLVADLGAEPPGDHLEPLPLSGVHVRGCDAAPGVGTELDQHVLPARRGRSLNEGHPLTGDWVHECLSLLNHCCLLVA